MLNLVVGVNNALFATVDSSQTGFQRTRAAHPSRQMITLAKPLFTEKMKSDDEGNGNLFPHPKKKKEDKPCGGAECLRTDEGGHRAVQTTLFCCLSGASENR